MIEKTSSLCTNFFGDYQKSHLWPNKGGVVGMDSCLSGRFYVIDFEYGAYGYRGYDLGNHFNEYAGFECDYSL